MQAHIPPRENLREPRDHDKHLYRQRRQVENALLHLEVWRGIATRYAKNLASFLAATPFGSVSRNDGVYRKGAKKHSGCEALTQKPT